MMKFSPISVVPHPHVRKRSTMKSSSLTHPDNTPTDSLGNRSADNSRIQSQTSKDMRTASSPAVAVTTQEGVDGSREKGMRSTSVEQAGSTGVMEISVKDDLDRLGKIGKPRRSVAD